MLEMNDNPIDKAVDGDPSLVLRARFGSPAVPCAILRQQHWIILLVMSKAKVLLTMKSHAVIALSDNLKTD